VHLVFFVAHVGMFWSGGIYVNCPSFQLFISGMHLQCYLPVAATFAFNLTEEKLCP